MTRSDCDLASFAQRLERPGNMFANQRRWMVGARFQCIQRVDRSRAVAQCDGDVAQPAFVADAADRIAGQAFVELCFAPREQFDQAGRIKTMARGEFPVAKAGEAIPRAAGLAVVATVNTVAY